MEIYLNRCKAVIAVAAFAMFSIYQIKAFAIESITLPVQVMGDDVVSISLPVISESETSVFDFILDPQGLLYSTDAARYGGGRVEEGATLLFHNKEGEYDFSRYSDWMTITNQSTVPVLVTITAQITDLGEVKITEDADFTENSEPSVYLALVDDKGNIQPISAAGETIIRLKMDAVPGNVYVYKLNEDTQTYQYGLSKDLNEIDFDIYSFGLMGACNPNADWQDISAHPTISVTWRVEPVITESEVAPIEKRDTVHNEDEQNPIVSEDSFNMEENTVSGNS